jgi:nesprin-1
VSCVSQVRRGCRFGVYFGPARIIIRFATGKLVNFMQTTLLQSITPVDQDESKEQLQLLRNHLLALSRAEPQLHSIKERALEISPTREPSIVEVLQLWQRVFRETFQQYHRLSARLVRSQDVAAALRLWQEYLAHVQDFLSSNLPGDYSGLSEDRNLCEVHKNLLTDQQKLILTVRSEDGKDLSITEQFNVLTNLHNESLVRIMERHAAVNDRLTGWERYRIDQSKLLSWLKDIDKERGRLQLRFIHVRRLDKILQRIEALLEKIPNGESQADALQRQQELLLRNCDETVAVSVRMEHAANTQRISNIRASLETWKEFVLRIKALNDKHVEQTAKITSIFCETNRAVAAITKVNSGSLAKIRQSLDTLQQHKTKLVTCTTDLETLGVITEQLRECLSPSDMKSLNQQSFLLWQQHGDLEHQLALLIYKLGERCSLQGRWESRCARLLVWMKDTENRIHNSDTPNVDEPEEALKRLECEVQAEMALKQRELEWVQNNGLELMNMAEPEDKEKLRTSLNEINERWSHLLTAGKSRVNKIVDLMQTMNTLQTRLAEIRAWLSSVETQISEPYVIESTSQATIDKKLRDHEQLQKSIEAESGIIGEVLNLCEILLSDCDAWKASFNTDAIKNGMEGLERRWKATCVKSSERKRKIMLTGKLLAELDSIRQEHEKWLNIVDIELEQLENSLSDLSKQNTDKTMAHAQNISQDIQAHQPALQILEQCYSRLAKGGLEPDNLKVLTTPTRQLIDRQVQISQSLSLGAFPSTL